MRFPSFEKFSSESDVPNTPDGSCAVNTLTHIAAELFWCIEPLSTMEKLLYTCPRLTVFKLIIPNGNRYRWMWDVGYEPLVTPRELVNALLQTHRQNLQTLHLDFHHHYDLSNPELREEVEHLEDCDYTYPSFHDFESLTHMAIEFEKLVKVQDLPASLERLDLHYCHFAELDRAFLSDLIQLKEKWCPVIKSVTVGGWDMTNEGIIAVREHARSLDISVHVTVDGRTLTMLAGGYHLTIKSLAPPFLELSTRGQDMDINNV